MGEEQDRQGSVQAGVKENEPSSMSPNSLLETSWKVKVLVSVVGTGLTRVIDRRMEGELTPNCKTPLLLDKAVHPRVQE